MSSAEKNKGDPGFILPPAEEIEPTGYIDVCFKIPDQSEHVGAFLSQIMGLARWYNWERDESRRGKDAAQVWARTITDHLRMGEACGSDTMVTFRFTEECGLEYSNDGGGVWTGVSGWSTFAEVCFKGDDGADGAPGAVGPAGPTGGLGPTGPAGPAGEDCECGETPPVNPQPVGAEATRCSIARSMAIKAQKIWDASFENAGLIQGLIGGGAGLVGAIVGFFIGGPLGAVVGASTLASAAFGFSGALNNLTQASFDEDAVNRMACTAYCILPTDTNELTAEILTEFISAVKADPDNEAIFFALGEDALFDALLLAVPLAEWQWEVWTAGNVAAAACISCECPVPDFDWCFEWDFSISNHGWNSSSVPIGDAYVSGQGWRSTLTTNQSALKQRSLNLVSGDFGANASAVAMRIISSGSKGSFKGTTGSLNQEVTAGISYTQIVLNTLLWDGDRNRLITFSAPRNLDRISVETFVGRENIIGAEDPGGEIIIKRIVVYGIGTPPTWTRGAVCSE